MKICNTAWTIKTACDFKLKRFIIVAIQKKMIKLKDYVSEKATTKQTARDNRLCFEKMYKKLFFFSILL